MLVGRLHFFINIQKYITIKEPGIFFRVSNSGKEKKRIRSACVSMSHSPSFVSSSEKSRRKSWLTKWSMHVYFPKNIFFISEFIKWYSKTW